MTTLDGAVQLTVDFDATLGGGIYEWKVTLHVGRTTFQSAGFQRNKQRAIEQVLRDNAALIAHEISVDHDILWKELREQERTQERAYRERVELEEAEAAQI